MVWCFLAVAQKSAVLPCEGFRIIRGRASFHRCLWAVRAVRVVVIPRVRSDWRDWRGCTGSSGNTGVRALGTVHTLGLARHKAAAGSYSTTGPI